MKGKCDYKLVFHLRLRRSIALLDLCEEMHALCQKIGNLGDGISTSEVYDRKDAEELEGETKEKEKLDRQPTSFKAQLES